MNTTKFTTILTMLLSCILCSCSKSLAAETRSTVLEPIEQQNFTDNFIFKAAVVVSIIAFIGWGISYGYSSGTGSYSGPSKDPVKDSIDVAQEWIEALEDWENCPLLTDKHEFFQELISFTLEPLNSSNTARNTIMNVINFIPSIFDKEKYTTEKELN